MSWGAWGMENGETLGRRNDPTERPTKKASVATGYVLEVEQFLRPLGSALSWKQEVVSWRHFCLWTKCEMQYRIRGTHFVGRDIRCSAAKSGQFGRVILGFGFVQTLYSHHESR